MKKNSIHVLTEYLKKNYPIIKKIKKIKQIEHNNIDSTNFFISSNTTKYVLRNFTDGSQPEKVEKICKILNFCAKKNLPVMQPIKNRKKLFVDPQKMMYLTKYYDGHLYDGTDNELKNLAKNLALLHKQLVQNSINYNYNTRNSFYKILDSSELQRIEKIINHKQAKDKLDKLVIKHLTFLKKSMLEVQKTSKIIRALNFKKQLIHNDLHRGNVIFNKANVYAIIDFNSMRKGYKIEEVAFASFRFGSYYTQNLSKIVQKMQIFLQNYLKYNDIQYDQITYFDYFLFHTILSRLSYIFRTRYFHNDYTWSIDLEKYLNFLILIHKLRKQIQSKITASMI